MCYYKLYIYDGCGHSLRSVRPARRCKIYWGYEKEKEEEEQRREEQELGRAMMEEGRQRGEEEDVAAGQGVAVTESDRVEKKHDKHDKHDSAVPSEWGRASVEIERGEGHGSTHGEGYDIPHPHPRPQNHSNPSHSNSSTPTCPDILTHAFLSYMIHTLCPTCAANRDALLSDVQDGHAMQFEDWKWKVKYWSPVPEQARYTMMGGGGGDHGQGWGEMMGSWVREKGSGLGWGLEGFLGGGRGGGRRGRGRG
ncbi:uncharacterized protein EI97DRAFT_441532 [Westerdykella ornata]|uniref:Uncharacterized protein n=1 Tax=Westerdykella ornata TaxID=318751 RepID=A0A6A6JLV7_WESOR|nr:uncharacterized protein EI97DRAFT_441532 [Westerdykella ornata]KAF2277487.1 hypothetical protein EI97DRAFT_441532 [Westerdykella ornata]